jgi:hypothetical protein
MYTVLPKRNSVHLRASLLIHIRQKEKIAGKIVSVEPDLTEMKFKPRSHT